MNREEISKLADIVIQDMRISEALAKQKPMKPVPLKYEPLILHGWEYGCPTCEKAVGFNKYAVEYTDEDPFCPSCGQKLDWGEE